jgi:hypothetical protein
MAALQFPDMFRTDPVAMSATRALVITSHGLRCTADAGSTWAARCPVSA